MTNNLVPEALYQTVKKYKRRFFINILLRGVILFFAIGLSYFLLIASLEYFVWFGSFVRAVFLFSFIGIVAVTSFIFILQPLYKLYHSEEQISDEKAAIELGNTFPQVKDKLLNILQLSTNSNSLAAASIRQKSLELSGVPFDQAIDFGQNKKYLKYVLPALFLFVTGAVFLPGLFTDSPKRIAGFTTIFPKPAPFAFRVLNSNLNGFRNEDFELKMVLEGKEMPAIVQLVFDGQPHVLEPNEKGEFVYTFQRMQHSIDFQFEGAGFYSEERSIQLIDKPIIGNINAKITYPKYLGRKEEYLKNIGNLNVPEGATIIWDVNCVHTDKIRLEMSNQKEPKVLEAGFMQGFTFSTIASKTFDYKLKLLNAKAEADGVLEYTVSVVSDAMPRISILPLKDSSMFNYVLLGGTIEDDHGFSALKVFYKVNRKNKPNNSNYSQFPIRFSKENPYQSFYLNWMVDTLQLMPGDKLDYYIKVWDNDGVNGPKAAMSQLYSFEIPSEKSISDEIRTKQAETSQNLSSSSAQSKSITKELDKLQNSLKNKKELSWQDRKNLEDLLQKQNELKERLESLQKQNQSTNEKEEKFLPTNEELANKTEQLQELMKDLLDDETLKLYDELQKLLEEKNNSPQIKDLLEKIDDKQERFDKELERMLEMFKQLKFEKELDKAIQEADKLSKEQDQLAEKTPQENQSIEKSKEEQQKINENFEGLKEELKKLDELNKSLEQQNKFDKEEATQKSISEKQQKSMEQMQQGNKKGAQKQQKSAAEQIEDLKEQLQAAQQEMEAEEVDENIEDLRALLENLLALSFEQEILMKEFKKINQTDPRYIGLLQREVKLKDDAKLVEDSLFALGKRVFQIKKFVTKEVGDMNDYIKESIVALKQRRPDISSGKQQFAMTSMNNLALMLSEVLKQLQEQKQQMKKKPGGGQCKKPGGKNKGAQSMSELQKALNQKIGELKGSGKQGKELSQELAKLIAEQQGIRKMLKEMEGKGGMDPNGKQQLKELAKKMEETERDLAFKQLSQQTIMRQNDIVTRLLESEKAQREREFEEKRESKTGNQTINNNYPPALEKYLKEKEKQIELLRSTQPGLNPYYKEKVGQYFQKISQ